MLKILLPLSLLFVGADPQSPRVKVGVVLSMTGETASFGEMTWTGIQLAKEMKPKILGKELDLILTDNKSDKIEAANAAQRVVQRDKVMAILGEVASSRSIAIASVAEANKIPQISPSSTNPLVTQGKRYVFRACFIDSFQGQVLATFALGTLGAKTAAVFTDIAQDYSVGLTNFFKSTFTKGGGKVTDLRYQSTDRDFSPQLTTLKKNPPDVILITGYYTEAALVAKQARALGIKSALLAGDGAEAPELVELGGEAVEGLYFSTHFDENSATTELGRQYVKLFRSKYNRAPDALGALGADSYFMLAEAIERAKSFDPTLVRDQIEKLNGFEVVSGAITMDSKHNAVKSAVIRKVEKGQFVFVSTVNP